MHGLRQKGKRGFFGMKICLRNIASFARGETVLFSVVIVCVFVSAFVLNFSYGLYQNYNVSIIEGDEELKDFIPTVAEDALLTKGEFQRYIEAISPEVQNEMTLIYCSSGEDAEWFPMRFLITDGSYRVPPLIRELWEDRGMVVEGRYLSDEESSAGKLAAVVSEESEESVGGTVRFLEKEYAVVGKYKGAGKTPLVPFLTVPDELQINDVSISFDKAINRKIFDELASTAAEIIPGKLVMPELSLADSDVVYLYNNIILISVLISVLSVMNFAMLYLFIIRKRKKPLAVLRICGAGRIRVSLICIGECLLITVPVYWLGTGLFCILLITVFGDIFPYMAGAFSPYIYLSIFGIYVLTMLAVVGGFIAKNISASIKSSITEGTI